MPKKECQHGYIFLDNCRKCPDNKNPYRPCPSYLDAKNEQIVSQRETSTIITYGQRIRNLNPKSK